MAHRSRLLAPYERGTYKFVRIRDTDNSDIDLDEDFDIRMIPVEKYVNAKRIMRLTIQELYALTITFSDVAFHGWKQGDDAIRETLEEMKDFIGDSVLNRYSPASPIVCAIRAMEEKMSLEAIAGDNIRFKLPDPYKEVSADFWKESFATAFKYANPRVLSKLLRTQYTSMRWSASMPEYLLRDAIKHGNLRIVAYAAYKKTFVCNPTMLLRHAAANNQTKIMKFLMRKIMKAQMGIPGDLDEWAAEQGSWKSLKLLKKWNMVKPNKVMCVLAHMGHHKVMQKILDHWGDASINFADVFSSACASGGEPECMKLAFAECKKRGIHVDLNGHLIELCENTPAPNSIRMICSLGANNVNEAMSALLSTYWEFEMLRALKDAGANNFNECLRKIVIHKWDQKYVIRCVLIIVKWGATNIDEAIALALENENTKLAHYLDHILKKRK